MEDVVGSVSVIVSSFGRRDLLEKCVASLNRTLPDDKDREMIVVDDASADGSSEWIESNLGSSWNKILLEKNVGFAAANNRAAREARGDILIFLNGDLELRPGWLTPMLDQLEAHPEAFAAGNVQVRADDGRLDHAGMGFLPDGLPVHDRSPHGAPWGHPAVSFACVAVRRERFFSLDGFDEFYRNGNEDVDLCLRARARGWPCFVAPASEVAHHISASPGRKDAETRNQRLFRQRWQPLAIQLSRDEDERRVRHRAGRRLPRAASGDDRAPARVLVDCSPSQHDDSRAERLLAVLVQIEQALPGRFEFHVLASANHLGVRKLASAFESGGKPPHSQTAHSAAEPRLTVWVSPDGDRPTPASSASNVRHLTEIGSTFVRDLGAYLLYLPFGGTPRTCPDIPIVSAVDQIRDGDPTSLESVDRLARVSYAIECRSAQVAQRLQSNFRRAAASVFVADSESDTARKLADAFEGALKAFSDGAVAWRWNPAIDLVADLPLAPDADEDEILLQIDEPTRWDNPVPVLQIRGWSLSNRSSAIAAVFARSADGAWEGVYGLARPDVAAAFPERDDAAASGFIVRLPRPTRVPNPISIEVRFADGRHVAALRPLVGARSAPSKKDEV